MEVHNSSYSPNYEAIQYLIASSGELEPMIFDNVKTASPERTKLLLKGLKEMGSTIDLYA